MHLRLAENLKLLLLIVRVCLLISSLASLIQCIRFNSSPVDNDNDSDGIINATDIDDDGDGLIEIGVSDLTTNPGTITNVHNNNDGTHYDDGINSIDTGCGGLNSITTCNGYELVSDVTIGSGWSSTTPGPSNLTGNIFSAIFDGNGHNIIITDDITSATSYVGLFGYVSGVLKNFTLKVTDNSAVIAVTSSYTGNKTNVGAVTGYLKGASSTNLAMITNVQVIGINVANTAGTIIAIGGLVGYAEDAIIENVQVIDLNVANTAGTTINIGGLVGSTVNTTVKNSYSTANLILSAANLAAVAGGLVGFSGIITTIDNSYATGDIVSSFSSTGNNFGGLVGFASSTSTIISNCYARGNLSSAGSSGSYIERIGGLIGYSNSAEVYYSYATGNITDTSTIMASKRASHLIGEGDPIYSSNNYSYYNVESEFPTTYTLTPPSASGTGEVFGYTLAELKTPIAPDYTFPTSMPPSTATDTEIGCIARGGQWASLTCTDGTANTLYTGWSTDNWDFGDATQLPALKFTDDSANLIPDQR